MIVDVDRPAPRLIQQLLVPVVSAVVCAFAMSAIVCFSTPIDDALPLIAVVLTVVAAVSSPVLLVSVPLLAGGEIAIGDERTRLLWFGVVIGASFAAALVARPTAFWRSATLTMCAIVLLRWIPLASVRVPREIVLIAVAVAIVAALRSTPLAVAVALAAALFTPLIPLRTLALPVAVLLAAVIWHFAVQHRSDGRQATIVGLAGSFATALMLIFFAWSGVFARALPVVWRGLPQRMPRATVNMALSPGESVEIDVPENARALIVSGANVSRLRRGTPIGTVEPGGATLRIGDLADWGSLRREHYYASRNRLPRHSAGVLRGYGYDAWIDGAARVALPRARAIRVTAGRALPPNARLQIESFELEMR